MKRAAAIPFENQKLGGQVHRLLSKSNGVCEVPILHWDWDGNCRPRPIVILKVGSRGIYERSANTSSVVLDRLSDQFATITQ